MIPIELKIKGLYSYQQEQTIDFDPLISGQLFGIFGSVGSGKSSILEAISFALYGETERLNQRDGRNYNMMNLKSDELLIDFTFDNYDQQRYRFTVKGKRHGKDFAQVGTFKRAAYKLVNHNWEPLEITNAESIIGLSYQNFHRTIIIPQGKFQEFLQLGEAERTKMLKEIFQLERFEFSLQTSALEKANTEKINVLQGQLLQFEQINADAILEKDSIVKKLGEEWSKLNAEHELIEKKSAELNELKKLLDQLAVYQKQLVEFQLKEPHFNQQEIQIKHYEFCLREFKNELQNKETLNFESEKLKVQLSTIEKDLSQGKHQLQTLEQQLKELTPEIEQEEILNKRVQDIKLLLQIRKAESGMLVEKQREEKGKEFVEQAKVNWQNKSEASSQLKSSIKKLSEAQPEMGVLVNVKEWFNTQKAIDKNIIELEEERENRKAQIARMQDQMNELIANPPIKELSNHTDWYSFVAAIPEYRSNLKVQKEGNLDSIQHCQLQMKLGVFAEEITAGKPCPLCGSDHHPDILIVDNVEEQEKALEEEKKMLETQVQLLDQTEKNISKLELNFQNIVKEFELIEEKISGKNKEKDGQQILFLWSEAFKDEAFLDREFIRANTSAELIKQNQKELEQAEQDLEKLQKDQTRFQEGLQTIQQTLSALSSEIATLQKQIHSVQISDYAHYSDEQLEKYNQETAAKILQNRTSFDKIQNEIQQRKIDLATLIAKQSSLQIQQEEKLLSFKKCTEDLEKKLQESEFDRWEQVLQILQNPLELDKLREEIQQFRQSLFSIKDQFRQQKDLVAGRSLNEEEFQNNNTALEASKTKRQELNDIVVREKAALESMQKQLLEKAKLESDLDKLQLRAGDLKVLRQMFTGSGFVSYISSVYLQNLCLVANERFYKLTRQQLRLEVNEKNEFLVRDYLHNGHLRSVKTLSGGQTFQASLSLALALAESVQQQSKATQNFFFLDEGFGSLDKDSLQLAFETLKSLRKENRIVGIISHVEDLQQEIDVFLSVKNDPIKGSLIRGNWES
jgi:exonuclease SbcC